MSKLGFKSKYVWLKGPFFFFPLLYYSVSANVTSVLALPVIKLYGPPWGFMLSPSFLTYEMGIIISLSCPHSQHTHTHLPPPCPAQSPWTSSASRKPCRCSGMSALPWSSAGPSHYQTGLQLLVTAWDDFIHHSCPCSLRGWLHEFGEHSSKSFSGSSYLSPLFSRSIHYSNKCYFMSSCNSFLLGRNFIWRWRAQGLKETRVWILTLQLNTVTWNRWLNNWV